MDAKSLKDQLETYCLEIDAEMRRRVRAAAGGGGFDLETYRLLAGLETLLISADALCCSVIVSDSERWVEL